MITPYRHVVFEVSGVCNAACKWCVTGRRNRDGNPFPGRNKFISPENFALALEYLSKKEIIDPNALFFLYNWGEPFLNPKINEIFEIITESGFEYAVSTNGSVPIKFSGSRDLTNLRAVVFSMPGFSKESYKRIHGFDFDRVSKNMLDTIRHFREHGFEGKVQVNFHAYRFNKNEAKSVLEFARKNDFCVAPTNASLIDLDLFMKFLLGTLPHKVEQEARDELEVEYIDSLKGSMPETFYCPYGDALFIDEDCDLVTCCLMTRDMPGYKLGNLFEMNLDSIAQAREDRDICRKCMGLEIPWLVKNRPYPVEIEKYDLVLNDIPTTRDIVVWGSGLMALDAALILKNNGRKVIGFLPSPQETAEVNQDRFTFVSRSVLQNANRPFVVIANEFVYPMRMTLESLGYKRDCDYSVRVIVRR